ncbi:MAG: hypothetical protein U5K31_14100 [Balneolaceae bacterium]|nr:hypothetical protein [Balneolaceae bacterium]
MKAPVSALLSTLLAAVLLMAGCSSPETNAPEAVDAPSGEASARVPNLQAGPDGGVWLSWVEENADSAGDGQAHLRYARWEENSWGASQTVASGNDWIVNWADIPSVTGVNGALLAAHWLREIPSPGFTYEVRMSLRGNGDWDDPFTLHDDSTATEHGFVSLLPRQDGSMLALWLDGRRTADRGPDSYFDLGQAMTLRSAEVDGDGVRNRRLVDPAICDCCNTALAAVPGGAVAAWRDRTEDEIRDISVARYRDGAWSEPVSVHQDGWNISACPVNGPALASSDSTVLLAWYTEAGGTPRVKASRSDDGGMSFGEPVTVDLGAPLGRVDAAISGDRLYVSWMEGSSGEEAAFMVREVFAGDDRPGTAQEVAAMSPSRGSGFPKMANADGQLLFAWTDLQGERPKIRTAVMKNLP